MVLNNTVLIGVIIGLITGLINGCVTILINTFQSSREKIRELQDIYAGCITSLATVSTLSGATESNMDTIELSLVEAKKWLALLLIRSNNSNNIKLIKEEVYLFTIGQYRKLLEKATIHPLQPINQSSGKYAYVSNQPLRELLSAADTMLQLIIKVGAKDKRLSL
ncbi:hypothetical protein [Nostoc sp.]|uniref:hypothetical protein n=1 Tax=Nostoc sp. TaxID=1180 RepID=UPI002FFA4523